jgi:hypothetical protein
MTINEILKELEPCTGRFPMDAMRAAIAQREAITPELLRVLEAVAENPEQYAVRREGAKVLKVIDGYGSSGQGGALCTGFRPECRRAEAVHELLQSPVPTAAAGRAPELRERGDEDQGGLHIYWEIPGIKHDLPRLSAWIGSDGLQFAVRHFGGGSKGE